jgi:hypothetical protein
MLRCTLLGAVAPHPQACRWSAAAAARRREPLIDDQLSNIYPPETFGQPSHVFMVAKGVTCALAAGAAVAPALCRRR